MALKKRRYLIVIGRGRKWFIWRVGRRRTPRFLLGHILHIAPLVFYILGPLRAAEEDM